MNKYLFEIIVFNLFKKRFTHSEILSNFYCDKCQMSMSANIKLTISQAPIVACFHLKVIEYIFFIFLNKYSVFFSVFNMLKNLDRKCVKKFLHIFHFLMNLI
jgi:hypothetical protein